MSEFFFDVLRVIHYLVAIAGVLGAIAITVFVIHLSFGNPWLLLLIPVLACFFSIAVVVWFRVLDWMSY